MNTLIINNKLINNLYDIQYYNRFINYFNFDEIEIDFNFLNLDIEINIDDYKIYMIIDNEFKINIKSKCKISKINICSNTINKLILNIKDYNNLKLLGFKNINNLSNLIINISNSEIYEFDFIQLNDYKIINQLLDIIDNSKLTNEIIYKFKNCNIDYYINNNNKIKKIILENSNINISNFINLEHLEIYYNIIKIPNSLINLKTLKINNCNNIKELSNSLINLKSLTINNCNNIK